MLEVVVIVDQLTTRGLLFYIGINILSFFWILFLSYEIEYIIIIILE